MGVEGFNKAGKNDDERVPIDELATKGYFAKKNLAGFDTYGDGLHDDRGLIPNTTVTESGGGYMEDKGPSDLVTRGADNDTKLATQSGLSISENPELDLDKTDGTKNDAAARWLRENDPNFKTKH